MLTSLRGLLTPFLLVCSTSACTDTVPSEMGTESGTDETGGELMPDPELCAPITIPVLDEAGARTLELVALREDIPGIADQPSVRGQILGGLGAFDGRLHLGYGDYSDNTGPIAMNAWDPGGEEWVELGTLPTEEVQWFRPGDGTLYVPATDPDTHEGFGGIFRLDCGSQKWWLGPPIDGAVHVYDVAVQGDTIYAGTGSLTGEPTQLMASQDHGQTWSEVLSRESEPEKFSRIYFQGATPDQLFVSGRSHPDPIESYAWIRTGGGAFEPLIDPPSNSLVPVVLGDDMVITEFLGDPGRGTYLNSYRIQGVNFLPDSPWPQLDGSPAKLVNWVPDADPDKLIALFAAADGSASIQRTDDLSEGADAWEELLVLDELEGDEFLSMALLLNDLYLGTRLGSLYALREIQNPAP